MVRFREPAEEEGGAPCEGRLPLVGAGWANRKSARARRSGAVCFPRASRARIKACRRPHLPGGITTEQVTPRSRRTVLAKAPHLVHWCRVVPLAVPRGQVKECKGP